jgi:hypothetical protein
MSSNYGNGTGVPRRCAQRLHEEKKARSFRQDPYILAYRYRDYMEKHPMRKSLGDKQRLNQYYQNLLANQPEPDPDATDDRSRAIRYAKEHLECYYEVRNVARIIGWLDEAEEKERRADMTTLLERIRSPSQSPHETSSP